MRVRLSTILAILVNLSLTFSAGAPQLAAQTSKPPGVATRPGLEPRAQRTPAVPGGEGLWTLPHEGDSPNRMVRVTPLATGGPDEFGYTWDDSVAYTWIDGTTETGLSSNCEPEVEVPVGFPFKYYENTYTSVYVSFNGYLNMQPDDGCTGGRHAPNPAPPNNTVAPYWVSMKNGIGAVRYTQGGTEPNRYLVIEWHAVQDFFAFSQTFEAVLHENGDITFAYQSMSWGGACAGTGIEDATGTDGLEYQYCSSMPSGKAVRFYRPPPQYRVRIWPLHVGSLASPGEAVGLAVPVRNTGDLGPDTYDLTVSSVWPVVLYAADGVTPLTDTDGDGLPDTGPVGQGGTFTVTAQVQVPMGAVLGDHNEAMLTATSSGDPAKSNSATLHVAVPAAFAQVYYDDADQEISLDLVQTAARATRKSAGDATYSRPAVDETVDGGFASIWPSYHWNGSVDTSELWAVVYDRYGHAAYPAFKLTDNSAATVQTYDGSAGVAAAPDGRIGVVWIRYLFDPDNYQYNRNVYFAVLDATGQLVYGPANVTNNDEWGWSFYWPDFWDPSLAATDDSHFVVAWQQAYGEPDGWVKDVYYTVRDSDGAEVRPITQWTFAPVGNYYGGYGQPNLARLSGSRVLLTWRNETEGDIYFGVLNSDGSVVKDATNLSTDGLAWADWGPDAVQLPNGNSVVAWTGEGGSEHRIRYAVLNSAYNRSFGPATLDDPGTILGSDDVSVTADSAGHVTLTWMEYSLCQMNLYVALLDGSGGLVTPAMPFHTSPAGCTYSSQTGYGNTSYSWTPPVDVDGVAAFGSTVSRGAPGGSSVLQMLSANHGTRTAQNVVLTLTLDPNLTYLSDTSGITPSFSGNDVIWSLPDLAFLDEDGFTVYIALPDGDPPGTAYPVVMNVASDGPEWNSADNTAYAEVMAVAQVFLPLILK
jgi:hypothetical protein